MRFRDGTVALPARHGARAVALGLLAEASDEAERLAAGRGEDALHDFRVAVRRLRTALRSFRPWLEDGVRRRDERKLRKVARSTNAARDAEVQLAWLADRREASARARRAGYELAVARLEERLPRRSDGVRVARRFRRTAGKLRRRLDRSGVQLAPPDGGAPFAAALASLVRDQASALAAQVQAIRDAADRDGAHRARIAAKRLRYLLEPLRGYRPADATAAVRRLRRVQDVLGELHDAHVLGAELGALLAEAAAERARLLHAAVLAPGPAAGRAVRIALRSSPRPGLVALLRLVRLDRDALFQALERERRTGIDAVLAEARAVATALEARAAEGTRTRSSGRRAATRKREGPSGAPGQARARIPVRATGGPRSAGS